MIVIVSEDAGEEDKFEKEGLDIRLHRKRMKSVDENGHDMEYKFKDTKDSLRIPKRNYRFRLLLKSF